MGPLRPGDDRAPLPCSSSALEVPGGGEDGLHLDGGQEREEEVGIYHPTISLKIILTMISLGMMSQRGRLF